MSRPPTLLFTLNLRHLTADGKRAAADLPPVQLHYIAASQLQSLLRSVEGIAGMIAYPAEPEIRISGPTGEFVVRVKDGQLHLVSWSSAHKGGTATTAEIIAAVTEQEPEKPTATRHESRPPLKPMKRPPSAAREKMTMIALALAIVLVNSFTIWILTRPPRSVVGKVRLLAPESAERLLADVAGAYETGKGDGDRRLDIRRDGSAQRTKFGAAGTVKDMQNFTVQGAESAGKRVLLTSRKSLITVKDSLSVVMFGDTYTRVTK